MKKVLAFLLGIWILSSCSSSSDGSTESAISQSVLDSVYRPAYHFSTAKNWVGVPLSMVSFNKEYHLFYQYNASGTKASSNSWGHAVSPDMLKWKEMPSIPDLGDFDQGSVVADVNNTSGLGQNILVAITADDDELSLSYSADNGINWNDHSDNPILEFEGTPKVSWIAETNQWLMTMTEETEVTFFSSDDLILWSQESQLSLNKPASSAELFSMQDAWGLLLNSETGIDFIVGEFDGSSFSPSGDATPFDLGPDNTAGTILKMEARSVFIGMMNNPAYMNDLPTKSWKSMLSLPRELSMNENNQLLSFPIKELNAVLNAKRRGKLALLKSSASNWYSFSTLSLSHDIELTISNYSGEKILLTYDQSSFTLDRSKSGLTGFNSDFSKVITSEYKSLSDTIQFDVFIDRSSVEIFINDGQIQFSSLAFPQNPYKSVSITVDGENRNVPAILYDVEVMMF